MELTWIAAASLLFVGVGYVFVQRAPRPRFVRWSLLCASLFALATRDLFRPRERGPPATGTTETEATKTEMTETETTEAKITDTEATEAEATGTTPTTPTPTNFPDHTDADERRRRTPLFARLRSRVTGWFD